MAMHFQPCKWHTHQTDQFQVIRCMQRETTATGNKHFHSQYVKGKMHIPSFQPFIWAPHTMNRGLVGPRAGSGHFGQREIPWMWPTHSLVTTQTTLWKQNIKSHTSLPSLHGTLSSFGVLLWLLPPLWGCSLISIPLQSTNVTSHYRAICNSKQLPCWEGNII